MGKFKCSCGNIISDSVIPNEVSGELLSEKSADRFFDVISSTIDDLIHQLNSGQLEHWRDKHFHSSYPEDLALNEMINDILTSKFSRFLLAMLECERCKRLWIQETVGSNKYRGYTPDDRGESGVKVLGLNQITTDL